MSGQDVSKKLGLKECTSCVDIKHEQWFPATEVPGQETRQCVVCSTEAGIAEVNQEASRGSLNDRRQACMIIQEKVTARLIWAENVRKKCQEQARQVERAASAVYKQLGEAGLAKLQTKNQLLQCELETAQWQEAQSEEEGSVEKREGPPEKRPRTGAETGPKTGRHETEQQRMRAKRPRNETATAGIQLDRVASEWLPKLEEHAGDEEQGTDLAGVSRAQERDQEGIKHWEMAAKAISEAAEETKRQRDLMERARTRISAQEQQTQAFLDHLGSESLRVAASMQEDLQEWKMQWKKECGSMSAAAEKGGAFFMEALKVQAGQSWAKVTAECAELTQETKEAIRKLTAQADALVRSERGVNLETPAQGAEEDKKGGSRHNTERGQSIAMQLSEAVQKIVEECMENAKQLRQEEAMSFPLQEYERLLKDQKMAEWRIKMCEEKMNELECGRCEMASRLGCAEHVQARSGMESLDKGTPEASSR